jgi:hypothetical protein
MNVNAVSSCESYPVMHAQVERCTLNRCICFGMLYRIPTQCIVAAVGILYSIPSRFTSLLYYAIIMYDGRIVDVYIEVTIVDNKIGLC